MPPRPNLQEGMRRDTFLIHGPDNFSYHFNKVMKGGRVYARCCAYHKKGCTAAISIDPDNGDCRTTGHHIHAPQRFIVHERVLRRTVLQRCRDREDLTNLHDIYTEELRNLRTPPEAMANLPYVKLRRSMERARREGLPPLPRSLSELARLLNDDQTKYLTQSSDEVDNIFAGVAGHTAQNTRCVLLFSQRQRRYLNSGTVRIVFSDGTFIAPEVAGCAQIFNLVTLRRRSHPHILPLGSILMQSKRTACYVAALTLLHTMCPNFRPQNIIKDVHFMRFQTVNYALNNITFMR